MLCEHFRRRDVDPCRLSLSCAGIYLGSFALPAGHARHHSAELAHRSGVALVGFTYPAHIGLEKILYITWTHWKSAFTGQILANKFTLTAVAERDQLAFCISHWWALFWVEVTQVKVEKVMIEGGDAAVF